MATSALQVDTGKLPPILDVQRTATGSLARGKETAEFLRFTLIASRLKLIHAWDFWHDPQDRTDGQATAGADHDPRAGPKYEARLVKLLSDIHSIKTFWQFFNNSANRLCNLKHRDSVHLFQSGTKPVWEDPSNVKGGSWTFRVPKEKAAQFWKELCALAVGGSLQNAVQTQRQSLQDDICGISYSVRFTSVLMTVWNKDGENKPGIENLLTAVVANLSPDIRPNQNQVYYRKHSEHAGFTGMVNRKAHTTALDENIN